eukprot:CAMPEP_0194754164 /NCGR_PEP_ID=MMETSP0323_2-20130528/8147_1 /TAXON_ID=2866 ORGANISM="Crypthecodinium cohnii, Strain Seligo" /NCGR_SAMPLE_ID=MMETSP0323_2 /ASSEMBLY_ACC=CAM_ASM_000346 /LENGTH=97 /DNA_ID=CAMNT_0039672531 /DNA_START=35 /DNA_END=328 /DNA_ORIENTATION=+
MSRMAEGAQPPSSMWEEWGVIENDEWEIACAHMTKKAEELKSTQSPSKVDVGNTGSRGPASRRARAVPLFLLPLLLAATAIEMAWWLGPPPPTSACS